MEHIKYIYSCPTDDCGCDLVYVYIPVEKEQSWEDMISEVGASCPGCGFELVFHEKISPEVE